MYSERDPEQIDDQMEWRRGRASAPPRRRLAAAALGRRRLGAERLERLDNLREARPRRGRLRPAALHERDVGRKPRRRRGAEARQAPGGRQRRPPPAHDLAHDRPRVGEGPRQRGRRDLEEHDAKGCDFILGSGR
jgi:hypothetical protein